MLLSSAHITVTEITVDEKYYEAHNLTLNIRIII